MEKKYSVLFVDDEENILRALERGLFDEDYNCIFAESGMRALTIMETQDIQRYQYEEIVYGDCKSVTNWRR